MATKQEFRLNDPTQLKSFVDELLEQTSDARVNGLQRLAGLQQRRAKRLAVTSQRLAETLGENNPRVVALSTAAVDTERLTVEVDEAARREASKPRIKDNEWAVFGRIKDPRGDPISGLTVRIVDKSGKLNETLPSSKTDELGGFSIVLAVTSSFSDGRAALELYLRVIDREGEQRFQSDKPLRPQAGGAEYHGITLGGAKPRPQRKKGVTRRRG